MRPGAARQTLLAIGTAGLLLAGCGRAATSAGDDAAQSATASETGYVTPPEAITARRGAGGLVFEGRSDPNVRVRLSSPGGAAFGATADASGAWQIVTPPSDSVRLFGLAEELGGRMVQAGGYLAALPAPGRPAVILRAGGGSEALGVSHAAPLIAVVDYDAGGGAVICGLAKPGATVRLTVDGNTPVELRADARGRYAITLVGLLKPGDHEAVVQSASGQDKADFTVTAASPITGLPYRGARQAAGWRIDWLTPGGGRQTTQVIDPAPGAQTP